jgi:pimeloyl-ACP methyl ester carboxylesterase
VGQKVPPVTDFSLAAQADTIDETLEFVEKEIIMDNSMTAGYDVVGFSLGGRIAMALACRHKQRVKRLHLTAVALERSTWGEVQITAWKDLLDYAATTHEDQQNGTALRPFAWSILLASYAPDFLDRYFDQLPLWVDKVCQQHTVVGLRALVNQTHSRQHHQNNDEWTVVTMARKLDGLGIKGRLVVGEDDKLAPLNQVEALADLLQWPMPTVLPGAAHVPPIETPRAWRQDIKDFLES